MNDYVRMLKKEIKDAEIKLQSATKSTKQNLIETFSGFCNQLSAHFKRRGDESQARIYKAKAEVYDDDEELESLNER